MYTLSPTSLTVLIKKTNPNTFKYNKTSVISRKGKVALFENSLIKTLCFKFIQMATSAAPLRMQNCEYSRSLKSIFIQYEQHAKWFYLMANY